METQVKPEPVPTVGDNTIVLQHVTWSNEFLEQMATIELQVLREGLNLRPFTLNTLISNRLVGIKPSVMAISKQRRTVWYKGILARMEVTPPEQPESQVGCATVGLENVVELIATPEPIVMPDPVARAGDELQEDLVSTQVNSQPDRTDPLVTDRAEMFRVFFEVETQELELIWDDEPELGITDDPRLLDL